MNSNCILNQIPYNELIIREYYIFLVTGKDLMYQFTDEEKICMKNFNYYNLKYFNKFIKYKEEELKKLQINLESKLLKSFIIYVKKINSKIEGFCLSNCLTNKLELPLDLYKYAFLIKLREFIFNQTFSP